MHPQSMTIDLATRSTHRLTLGQPIAPPMLIRLSLGGNDYNMGFREVEWDKLGQATAETERKTNSPLVKSVRGGVW